jgi:hypothetical protein
VSVNMGMSHWVLSVRKFFSQKLKILTVFVLSFNEVSINPNFMCSDSNKILFLTKGGRFLTYFSPGTEVSLRGQSIIF